MRPLILMPTINSRHWNACYLLTAAVCTEMPAPPPQAERSCWGGQTPPPSSRDELSCAGGVASRVRPLFVERKKNPRRKKEKQTHGAAPARSVASIFSSCAVRGGRVLRPSGLAAI